MYKFYYQHLKYKYGARCELLYTDTDSLLLEIKTEDIYEDMGCHKRYYDTSDYPEDHPLHSQKNKKVLGKMKDECNGKLISEVVRLRRRHNKKVLGEMKDECNGKLISEVVCLRSKMYSIVIEGGENKKKANGTKKVVTKKEISHQNYKDALFGKQSFKHGMYMFRSENHQIFGVHLNKTSLSLPSTPSAGSRKTAFTRWRTATKTRARPTNANPTLGKPPHAQLNKRQPSTYTMGRRRSGATTSSLRRAIRNPHRYKIIGFEQQANLVRMRAATQTRARDRLVATECPAAQPAALREQIPAWARHTGSTPRAHPVW